MFDVKVCSQVIDPSLLNALIEDFESGPDKHIVGRRFKVDTQQAQSLLATMLSELLPGRWVIDGGNYFETVFPYRLHVDTGQAPVKKLHYNVVIPLKLWTQDYQPQHNKLIITDQTWQGDAAFFVRGDPGAVSEYNICVRDYDTVGNLGQGIDPQLAGLCSHLNPQSLWGFTVKQTVDWRPGDVIIFRRHYIHTTSNWRDLAGVKMKLGLSLFTSRVDD
jgi:hypothetical protein